MGVGQERKQKQQQQWTELQDGLFWSRVEEEGVTVLGLTEKALDELGEIARIESSGEGESILQGEVLVRIEGDQGTLELVSPEDAAVVRSNREATRDPSRVQEDPTGEGWLIGIL